MKVIRINLRSVLSILVLMLGTLVTASASDILVNGSFETPDQGGGFTYTPAGPGVGWTFVGGSGIAANGSAWLFTDAPDGTQVAFMQGIASILQNVDLTLGAEYTLSYYLEQRPGYGVNPITVSIGGSQLDYFANPPAAWTLYSDTFIATSSNESLVFSTGNSNDTGGDYDAGLDGVSITMDASPAPEPGTMMLFGSGLVMLAGLVRRRLSRVS